MRKLAVLILLCCMTLIFSNCDTVNRDFKIKKGIEGQELYVFSNYKGSLLSSSIKYGYLNSKGDVFIEPYFEYAEDFTDSFAKVQVRNDFGIINKKGEYVLKPAFSDCKYLGLGIIAYKGVNGSEWILKNINGYELTTNTFEEIRKFSEGLAAVQINNKWGFINHDAKLIVNPQFDFVSNFKDGFCHIQVNDKWGLINISGNVVVEPKYEEKIQVNDDYIVVQGDNGRWGYMDKMGNVKISYSYEMAKTFSEESAAVKIAGKWGYINKQGITVIEPNYEEATPFVKGLAKVKQGGKYWYIDKKGKQIKAVIFNYTNMLEFKDGMAVICCNGKYGFVNEKMEVIIEPNYDYYKDFCEGFAVVGKQIPDSYDSAYGYLDKKGNWLLEPIFTHAESFKNGLAKVLASGKMGYINNKGDFIYKDW